MFYYTIKKSYFKALKEIDLYLCEAGSAWGLLQDADTWHTLTEAKKELLYLRKHAPKDSGLKIAHIQRVVHELSPVGAPIEVE